MPSPPFSSSASSWLLEHVSAHIQPLTLDVSSRACWILRDDLLHPFANGNKLRKLDGYLPALMARGVTDILTCGGVQSAHCAALSCLGAERGIKVHALVRGERPAHPTGNLAITMMYATSLTYVARDLYAQRARMFEHASERLARSLSPDQRLEIVPEGGRSPLAARGFIRLIAHLATALPSPADPWELVIDAGTGVSVAGLAAGILSQSLPWRVRGVMLMKGAQHTYEQEARALLDLLGHPPHQELPWVWEERSPPRRFGAIKAGDLMRCRDIARRTGVMFDPLYTLASYESVCAQPSRQDARTLLIHTGGALNLFGALSRYPDAFDNIPALSVPTP